MAVIVKYIVVRNGEEKMTFATKKEADAYDKMLDIADNMYEFLEKEKLKLTENQLEKISFCLAEKRDDVISVLRGSTPKKKSVKKAEPKKVEPKKGEPKKGEPKKGEPKKGEPKKVKVKE